MKLNILNLIVIYMAIDRVLSLSIESNTNELDDTDNVNYDEIDLTDLENIMYGLPSEETGKRVSLWRKEDKVNPEELGEYAQGDILFSPHSLKSGLREKRYRWPNALVPYMISPIFNQHEHSLIMQGMETISKSTCIKFIPRTGEDGYIRFQSANSGCWSSIGYTGSRVDINLQKPGCVTKIGTVEHEIMHSLGFIHEQSRDDRDDNVYIQHENIKPGTEINFNKYSKNIINNFGKRYDYESVMHYSPYAFSANGKPTIIARNNNIIEGDKNRLMGQRDRLSPIDIEKINRMYNCYGKSNMDNKLK